MLVLLALLVVSGTGVAIVLTSASTNRPIQIANTRAAIDFGRPKVEPASDAGAPAGDIENVDVAGMEKPRDTKADGQPARIQNRTAVERRKRYERRIKHDRRGATPPKQTAKEVAPEKSATTEPKTAKEIVAQALKTDTPALKAEDKTKESPPAPKPTPADKKPEEEEPGLTKTQIRAGFRKIRPLVERCADRYRVGGLYRMKIVIAPSGKVTSVRIQRNQVGSLTARCIQAAVRTAKFPAFKAKPLSFIYPFLVK